VRFLVLDIMMTGEVVKYYFAQYNSYGIVGQN
jgi:hypothetical protein